MTNELPPGWEWARVDELCEVTLGQSPPGSSYNDIGQGLPFLQGKAEFGATYPSIRKWTTRPKKHAAAGSVLVSVRAPVGPTNLAPVDCSIGRGLAALKPREPIAAGFVLWAMRASEKRLVEQASGSTFDAITGARLREHRIPVPPLAEQQRIVGAIEEHFSRLDAVETALSAAQQKAGALLRVAVAEECRGSWETVPLAEIITSLRNGVFVSRPAAEPPGRPIYRISAVRPLRLRIDDIRYALPEPKGADEYAVKSGDVLFTRYSGNPSYVGAAAVVPDAGSGVLHPDKLIRVVVDRAQILPEWLAAYVSVGEGRRQIEMRLKTTAGQVGISGGQLKGVPIATPPLDYQRSAVEKIGAVMADQSRVERQLTTLRAKSSALRHSVLARALAGQLLPQEPGDEPAPALLERIGTAR